MTPLDYVADLKSRLVTRHFIVSFEIVEEWTHSDRGYIRIRMLLSNADFLEVAEYFVFSHGSCFPMRYRYQWMDSSQEQIRRRWDNVGHYPNLPNFPHHVHFDDGRVEPGKRLSIVDLLDQLSEMCF